MDLLECQQENLINTLLVAAATGRTCLENQKINSLMSLVTKFLFEFLCNQMLTAVAMWSVEEVKLFEVVQAVDGIFAHFPGEFRFNCLKWFEGIKNERTRIEKMIKSLLKDFENINFLNVIIKETFFFLLKFVLKKKKFFRRKNGYFECNYMNLVDIPFVYLFPGRFLLCLLFTWLRHLAVCFHCSSK